MFLIRKKACNARLPKTTTDETSPKLSERLAGIFHTLKTFRELFQFYYKSSFKKISENFGIWENLGEFGGVLASSEDFKRVWESSREFSRQL